MRRLIYKRFLGSLLLLAFVVMGFQNCSLSSVHQNSDLASVAGKACDTVLKSVYAETYYQTFQQRCTTCHSGGEAGSSRAFAVADLDKAYAPFASLGRLRVEQMATNPGHRPPNTGPDLQAMVAAAQSKWAAAEAASLNCGSTPTGVETTEKSTPTIFTALPGNNVTWPRITWDLRTEMKDPALNGQISMTFSIEIRRFMNTTVTPAVPAGYEFRNPVIRVISANGSASASIYRIKNVQIELNGKVLDTMSAYTMFDYNVNSITDLNLAPNAAFGLSTSSTVSSSDKFALLFERLEPAPGQPISTIVTPGNSANAVTLPTRISYADMTGANTLLNIFSRGCVGCHGGANPSAGLNLRDYTMAFNNRDLIRSRMNNANQPMPTSGLMSARDRQVLDIWINSGAPQN
jgi:mono/diheme cytochrome c family protein